MSRRIEVLDALRGVAVLSIVLMHYTTNFRTIYGLSNTETFDFKYGYLGVQLFFMISGFVIFMTLDNVKSSKEFIVKRFVRLYPTYWLCILITLAVIYFSDFDKLKVNLSDIPWNFTMFQDFFTPYITIRHIDGVYWSLMPELFFYGFMLTLYHFKLFNHIKIIGFIWLLISVIYYTLDLHAFKLGIIFNLRWSPFFFAGIMFYILWRDNNEKKKIENYILILFSLLSYLIINLFKIEGSLESNNVEGFVVSLFFIFFLLFVNHKLDFLGKIKPLLFLGKISYPWYLLHQNIGYIILYFLFTFSEFNSIYILLIPMAITILLAYWITQYFEKPYLEVFKRKMLE